jgi:hypothetical protein
VSAETAAAAILSLPPRVGREEAIRRLGGGSLPRLIGRPPLRSVGEVFVPFHVYRVEIVDGGRSWRSWLAVDAVSGTLDPYEFEHRPTEDELSRVETKNRARPLLSAEASACALRDKLRRLRYQAGFFRVREPRFTLERLPLDLHVPYWLGFYGSGERATLRVLDAVRRRLEGGRARALFEDWLAA